MKKEYWDLTDRPHTELKLRILEEYIYAWATIFFAHGIKKNIETYKEIYYVDCFAGRGKYHKNGKQDSVLGSPLIALECAIAMQKRYEHEVRLKCIFVEENKTYHRELSDFCESYKGKVNFELLPRGDFNDYCKQILSKIKTSPSFFFIDPGGIEIKKETTKQIVRKEGPNDILFNYIKSGVERIAGLIRKTETSLPSDEKEALKRVKTIKTLTDFFGMDIYGNLDKNERERLKYWVEEILKSGNLKEVSVFDMTDPKRSGSIYYLLFASRKPVAKKIIKDIFKKAKHEGYFGQMRIPMNDINNFEI